MVDFVRLLIDEVKGGENIKTHRHTHTYTQNLLKDCLKDINEVRGGEAQVQSSDLHQL